MNYIEIDPSDEEKPNQLTWNIPDDQDVLYHVRSYRCSFCKRGFSNAQALGGHMNIHRKDRAKLKEVSSGSSHHENNNNVRDSHNHQLSLSINGDHRGISRHEKRASGSSSSDQEIEILTNPEEQLQGLQLSLFVKAPSIVDDDEEENDRVTAKHAKRSMRSSRKGESLPELDLELRLGTNIPSEKC